jgi:hypothetical protein
LKRLAAVVRCELHDAEVLQERNKAEEGLTSQFATITGII